MEYVTILETNHKEDESVLFYVQWTGNEEPLTWLYNIIKRSCCDYMCGNYSSFDMDTDVKFSEDMVDLQCRLPYGSYAAMFKKAKGECFIPKSWRKEAEDKDDYKVATWLDDMFYGCRIPEIFFKKGIPYYLKEEDTCVPDNE